MSTQELTQELKPKLTQELKPDFTQEDEKSQNHRLIEEEKSEQGQVRPFFLTMKSSLLTPPPPPKIK